MNSENQALAIDCGPILHVANNMKNRTGKLDQNLDTLATNIFTKCAETLAVSDKLQLVDAMKPHLNKLVQIRKEVYAFGEAMRAVIRNFRSPGYTPDPNSPTDFDKLIKDEMQTCMDNQRMQRLEDHEWYKLTLQAAGIDAEEQQEPEDDDVVLEQGGGLAPNIKCPITGVPILELQDPVQDQVGYVYEKAAIVNIINSIADKSLPCPVVGTSHILTERVFKPANKVRVEQRKIRLGGNSGQGTQVDVDLIGK